MLASGASVVVIYEDSEIRSWLGSPVRSITVIPSNSVGCRSCFDGLLSMGSINRAKIDNIYTYGVCSISKMPFVYRFEGMGNSNQCLR